MCGPRRSSSSFSFPSQLLLLFIFSLHCWHNIQAAQLDLLKFVLNVKPGIREPSPSSPSPPLKTSVKHTGGVSGLSPGFNAISIGNVLQGQSKSSSSLSMAGGGSSGGGAQQQQQTQGGKSDGANGGGIGGPARKEQARPTVGHPSKQPLAPQNAQSNAPPPPRPPSPVASIPMGAKPSAEDPYGLEIGGVVEPTGTTTRPPSPPEPTTKITVPPSPPPIATTAPPSKATTSTTTVATTTPSTTTKMPPCGPDVLFVLDSTGSVRLVYEDQRKYILDVAQQMDIAPNGQHVGLILYSSRLKQRVVVGLDEALDKQHFLQIVQELPYHGGITATGNALELTVKALAKRRPNKRTLVVVLTDGFTYDEWLTPTKALQSLGPGVDVIVAGDVKIYARQILEKIAGDPGRVLLGEENKSKALDYLRCR